ncbi:NAD-dependent epimerase/dehydratase family protein [Parapedobacter indicus]|uniref:Nucleoside-diphosphate-sugar epimerase n=1 Tax=Parapedobacter indicus TaxID=1477437 RepID=A0A1I3J5Y4_9SPHI|nr:NAD-dependent epimerase/dehydratase family protein [Parapedobacter indicus]PPL02399.1 nucleoside-diphosphate-sugar epimerase [Parapedobacter indicus]SFI55388.1 Nucleoside-diphosphate-sugar epimerase [Parapedobacter indicus]
MKVLIVGCGWVGTYVASCLRDEGHRIWATCRTPKKALELDFIGLRSYVVDFDRDDAVGHLNETTFDVVIISIPITHKDAFETVTIRFERLVSFLRNLSFGQLLFFGSVGIYPKVSGVIVEDTFAADELDQKLWTGESMLRSAFSKLNVLRLGGLFGFERTLAKYFVDKVCEIGYQTANFVHVEDIYAIIRLMMEKEVQSKTYNVVCPEHPLKKDVITASAAKYGYGLPASFTATDQTTKMVSPKRLMADLDYSFVYRSPLQF